MQDLQRGLKDVVAYLNSLDVVHLETGWNPLDGHEVNTLVDTTQYVFL